MTNNTFPALLRALIDEKLEPGASKNLSIPKIIAKLGLKDVTSRETIRNILRNDLVPSASLQQQLLQILKPMDPGTEYCNGKKAKAIKSILGDKRNVESHLNETMTEADFVFDSFGMGIDKIFFRCIDDEPESGLPEEVLISLIDDSVKIMKDLGITKGVFITGAAVNEWTASYSSQKQISIITFVDFLKRKIPFDDVEQYFIEMRQEKKINKQFYMSQCANFVTIDDKKNEVADKGLVDFFKDNGCIKVATILGSYGTGKSSLMSVLAHFVAEHYKTGTVNWSIPIWIKASSIANDASIIETIWAALVSQFPNSTFTKDVAEILVKAGRLWLFIDGVDESPELKSEFQIQCMLDELFNLVLPSGKIIISCRRELFSSFEVEQKLFLQKVIEHQGRAKAVIIELEKFTEQTRDSLIIARLGARDGRVLLDKIKTSPVYLELASRPIFLHIITETAEHLLGSAKTSIFSLFETYIKKWTFHDLKKRNLDPSREDIRIKACEFLSVLSVRFGESNNGFSVEELVNFATSLKQKLSIGDPNDFVLEARVAMFLERRGRNRFVISHQSIKEFLICRKLGREFVEKNMLTWGALKFDESMPLVRSFLHEFFEMEKLDWYVALTSEIQRCLSWTGSPKEELLVGQHSYSPPYGVGHYEHCLPNLLYLVSNSLSNIRENLQMAGSNLACANLSYLTPAMVQKIDFENANFEGAIVNENTIESLGKSIIPPNSFCDYKEQHSFCRSNSLFEKSNYFTAAHPTIDEEEFVLIPGGKYMVPSSTGDPVEVTSPGFLIQKFPVTNGQFQQFVNEFPYWSQTRRVRGEGNSWYLKHWAEEGCKEKLLPSPVTLISWYAASAYAASIGLRLPTEKEWEIAARFTQKKITTFPWGNNSSDHFAFTEENSDNLFSPGKSVFEQPKDFAKWRSNLEFDVPRHMVGLVKEYVMDDFSENYPSVHSFNSGFQRKEDGTWGPNAVSFDLKVIRGGSYLSPLKTATCQVRTSQPAYNVNSDVGFRCVRPILVTQKK